MGAFGVQNGLGFSLWVPYFSSSTPHVGGGARRQKPALLHLTVPLMSQPQGSVIPKARFSVLSGNSEKQKAAVGVESSKGSMR